MFAPLGFGQWEASGALVTGLIAKEVVVGTLAQVYGGAEEEEGAPGDEPATLADDLTGIAGGFVTAVGDAVRALPGIVGINLVEAEEEPVAEGLAAAIRTGSMASSGGHGSLAALAFLVFVLLYTPCVAALAANRHEFGTPWMLVSLLGQFAIAWLAAFIVFQGGVIMGR